MFFYQLEMYLMFNINQTFSFDVLILASLKLVATLPFVSAGSLLYLLHLKPARNQRCLVPGSRG